MKRFYLVLSLMVSFAACNSPKMAVTPMTCNGYTITALALPFCEPFPSGLLIQTPLNQQAEFALPYAHLTLNGTLSLTITDNSTRLSLLEGSAIIGASDTYRTLSTGKEIIITLDADDAPTVSDPESYNFAQLSDLPLDSLPRAISLIEPTVTPTSAPNLIEGCQPPADWTDRYTIERGDTLTQLASTFNLSLPELQSGNCISNPNLIQPGDIIFAPFGSVRPTQPAVTFTPSAVDFRADKVNIIAGTCTFIRWDVRNVQAIYLDSAPVSEQGSLQVWPAETTSYQLIVHYYDDSETQHQVSVTVTKS